MFISKSKYVSGCQCPKILWMQKYMPEMFDKSVMNEAILATGDKVGDLAMQRFGDYVEIPYMKGSYDRMAEMTNSLIESGVPTICEATFFKDGRFCMVDILRQEDDGVHLIEVKSSTHVKDYHLLDIAFQLWLLEQCGLNVKSASLMHLNPAYVREGDINIQELFTIEDVTEHARELAADVPRKLDEFESIYSCASEPDTPIGLQCDSPFECGYKKWCWKDVPKPSVHDISRLSSSQAWAMHKSGIVSFEDVSLAMQADQLDLNPKQVNQVMAHVNGLDDIIIPSEIREFLDQLTYPLYFLDFETIMPAIPLYDGMRPYQQLPTQYSLHWQDKPGGKLHHTELLADPNIDPRYTIATHLCEDIPKDACVLAYNMAFEKGRIRDLADRFPDLYDHLMSIHDNMKDLMAPFAQGSYYSRAMQGSHSIKYVLPALFPNDPELDYSSLDTVHNGGEAMDAYASLAVASDEDAASIRENLLRYCELDTLAMVKILEKLIEVAEFTLPTQSANLSSLSNS